MTRLLLLAVLALGCGYTHSDNNGARGELSFDGGEEPGVVGQTIGLTVARGALYSCKSDGSPNVYPGIGGGSGDSCTVLDGAHAITATVAASCGDGCTATAVGADTVEVTGLRAGTSRLDVTVQLDDGTSVTDSTAVSFVEVDRIGVFVGKADAIGPNAMFVGATLPMSVIVQAGTKQIQRMPEVWATPDGVVDVSAPPSGTALGGFQVTGRAPGRAELHVRSGSFETVHPLRVAAVADAVEASLWTVVNPDFVDAELDESTLGEELGAVLSARKEVYDNGFGVTLLVAWRLTDGTLALGGAKTVTADDSHLVMRVEGQAGVTVWPGSVGGAGHSVTLHGQVGSAVLSRTLTFRVAP